MPLPSSRRSGLRAGRQMQVEFAKPRLRELSRPFVGNGLKPFPTAVCRNKPAPCLIRGRMRVASRRIRSDFLPRLRAETCALMRCPKLSTQGGSSQGVESKHYGVQARRRDGEAAGQRSRWAFFGSPVRISL
jgi:hypothetical protein